MLCETGKGCEDIGGENAERNGGETAGSGSAPNRERRVRLDKSLLHRTTRVTRGLDRTRSKRLGKWGQVYLSRVRENAGKRGTLPIFLDT